MQNVRGRVYNRIFDCTQWGMQNVGGRVYCGVFGCTQAPEVGESVEAEDGRGAVGEVFERG